MAEMINVLVIALFLLLSPAALAQTFLGDGNGTSGKGGSCCNWTAMIDASGQSCPVSELAARPTCQVITQTQWQTFVTSVTKPTPKCNPGSVVSDGTNLQVCATDGAKFTKFPLTALGTGTVVTPMLTTPSMYQRIMDTIKRTAPDWSTVP